MVPVKQPEAGHDVRLTIDLPTQHVAEESLAQGMEGARGLVDNQTGYFQANAGAVVVLDARTGAVVAMASNPSFNPNDFISGNSDQYFKDPDNPPLLNRALNAVRAGLDVQADHVARDAAEPAAVPRRSEHDLQTTIPTAASTSATTRRRATRAARCSAP